MYRFLTEYYDFDKLCRFAGPDIVARDWSHAEWWAWVMGVTLVGIYTDEVRYD